MGASDAALPARPSTFRHDGAHFSMLRRPRGRAHEYDTDSYNSGAGTRIFPSPTASSLFLPTSPSTSHPLNPEPDHGQGSVDSGTSPPVFLQQKAELEHESILHPVHDPFDTSPEQVCEKLAWFLVLLLPILTAVLVSVFVVGCPACCSCCWCSRSADKRKKRGDEEDHLREKESVTSAGGRGDLHPRPSSSSSNPAKHPNKNEGRPQSGGGASRPQEGEGEQPQDEGGGREDDVDSQVAELEKLFSEIHARDSASAAKLSMLEQLHQHEGGSSHGKSSYVEPDSERPAAAGSGSRRSAKMERENHDEGVERKCYCPEPPRRGGRQCCWMNCAVWTLAALIMVLIEWLCLSYAVSDQHWDHNPRTKVVIITSAGLSKGGEGYLMATKWLREEMVKKVEGMDQSKCSDPSGGCCAKRRQEKVPGWVSGCVGCVSVGVV